jgi:hypothetical protein
MTKKREGAIKLNYASLIQGEVLCILEKRAIRVE